MWKKINFFLLGFGSTAQVLALVIGSHTISLYTVTMLIGLIILIIDGKQDCVNSKEDIYFKKWTFISLLASLFGCIYFIEYTSFIEASLSAIPKILIYYFIYKLLNSASRGCYFSKYILLGLKYGIVTNLVWAVIDTTIYYTLGYSISNRLFTAYIQANDIRFEMLSLIDNFGRIRSSGLNADPANIGLFAIIMSFYAVYKRRPVYLLIAISADIASVSFTGILGTLIAILYYCVFLLKSVKYVVAIAFFCIVGYIGLSTIDNPIFSTMIEAVNVRAESKQGTTMGDEKRSDYFENFPQAVVEMPTSFVIGTGYSTASFSYVKNGLVKNDLSPYDPECTYFSNFLDLGLFGFFFFIMTFISLFRNLKNKPDLLENNNYMFAISSILGCLVAFWGYHYTLYSVVMLVVIISIVISKNNILTNIESQ